MKTSRIKFESASSGQVFESSYDHHEKYDHVGDIPAM